MATVVRLTDQGNNPIWVNLDTVAFVGVAQDGRTRLTFTMVVPGTEHATAYPYAVDVKEHPDEIWGQPKHEVKSP